MPTTTLVRPSVCLSRRVAFAPSLAQRFLGAETRRGAGSEAAEAAQRERKSWQMFTIAAAADRDGTGGTDEGAAKGATEARGAAEGPALRPTSDDN